MGSPSPGGVRAYTDEELKKIVRLHDEEGLQFKVIAQRLGRSRGNVNERYHEEKKRQEEERSK